MGDLDGIIERNGNILVLEWKAGADLDAFDSIHIAQLITAKAFTANSDKQRWLFVIGDPKTMQVEHIRLVMDGDWAGDWYPCSLGELKQKLAKWWDRVNG